MRDRDERKAKDEMKILRRKKDAAENKSMELGDCIYSSIHTQLH